MMRRELKTTEAERERKRRYYQANKAMLKAKSAQYKRDNPDKVRQYTATYRERYRLELRMRAAIYFWRNRDAVLRRMREAYAAKPMTYRRAGGCAA
jgi:hypothetical protein